MMNELNTEELEAVTGGCVGSCCGQCGACYSEYIKTVEVFGMTVETRSYPCAATLQN
jgi:bacteriocin-like protein